MAECPTSRTNRGIRTQFRLGLPGLGLLKGLYPGHTGDIMDTEQSSTSGVASARELVSPSKGTRTRTVREYEETIDELQKENFDLKLRLHFYENPKRFSSKGKSDGSSDTDTVKIVLDLKLETEALRKDLAYKDKLLQEAVERAEKCELDFKELEIKYEELEKELSSLSELPSKQEFSSLIEEKENLTKQNEMFQQTFAEKDQQIQVIREQIEILANQNIVLEEKIKKRNVALQNLVYNKVREEEMFPEELRNVVYSGTQAAKSQSKEGLVVAVKSFASALNRIMSSSSVNKSLNESEEKENVGSPRAKCLKEEFLEKSSAFLPSQTDSFTELSHIEGLKEALSRRNSPSCKECDTLDSTVHDSFARGNLLNESSVNVCKKEILDYLTFSPMCKSAAEERLKLPSTQSSQLCPDKADLIDIETISLPPVYPDSMCQDNLPKTEVSKFSSDKEHLLMKENKNLKLIIEELRAAESGSKHRIVHLHDKRTDAMKASDSACTQTDIVGSHLLREYEKTKLQKDAKLSNNVDELREDVLLLLLTVEDKNKELLDIKETLSKVQEDLTKALNTSNNMLDKEYMNERNELHERLAFSSSVNEELIKHLRSLEAFMEDLLKHKFESSMESLSEKSDVLSSVSRCLNESLKLSNVLSNHLSFCEGSKLFEECESILYRSTRFSDAKSLPNLNASEMIVPPEYSLSYPDDVTIRTHHYEESIPFVKKSDDQMNKELDGQLCWRCWQQLNSFPVNKPDDSNVVQNTSLKCMPYATSDSDIWSEPDRNVSMQRIGISLENSPVSSKSPRKSRFKDKRTLNKLNSNMDTSSSEVQRWSRQRRHGSVSRRLFGRDSIKGAELVSEKFYCLLAEKYSKFNMLLEALENVKDSGITNEVWMKMNAVVTSLKESIQKLHITKESAKNYPSTTCQKCVMLELFMDLKSSHIEDVFIDDLSVVETEILQQFQDEVQQLKDSCKEPFSLLSEVVCKRSQSTQSDVEQTNSEFENAYIELNARNESLIQSLEEMKRLLSKEKEASQSLQSENKDLYNKLKKLSKELSELRHKDNKLSIKNDELVVELENINRKNLELISSVADLEQKKRRFSDTLEELTETLQLNKSDLTDNEQAVDELKNANNELTFENKKLNIDLDGVKKMLSGEKESMKLIKSENQQLENQIHSLSKELLEVKQREGQLCVRNEELLDELTNIKQKNLELATAMVDLDQQKEKISSSLDELTKEMQLNRSNLISNEQSVIKLKNANIDLNHLNENLNRNMEEVKRCLSIEKKASETLKSENRDLYDKINNLTKELLGIRLNWEKVSLKKEELAEELAHAIQNNSELTSCVTDLEQKKRKLCSTIDELTGELQLNRSYLEENKQIVIELKNINIDLNDKNKNLNRQSEEIQRLYSAQKEAMILIKTENNDLSHKINNLTKELLEMRMKKDKLSARNEELVEELASVNRKNVELSSTVADLELRKERFSSSVDELTEELQLNRSDLEDNEQVVIALKNANNQLNYKNENLNRKLDEFKRLFTTEQDAMKSVKSDNRELRNQMNNLTKELLETRQKKDKLSVQNEDLLEELTSINKKNLELISAVTDLEQREQKYSCSLNELTQELQLNKSYLNDTRQALSELKSTNIDLDDKNQNLNKNLDEINRLLSNEKEALKFVKSENRELNSQINNLTEELMEMRQKEGKLALKSEELSKELANVLNKNFELSSTIEDLKENRRKSSEMLIKLTEQLQLSKSDLNDKEKLKMSELEDAIIDLNNKNKSLSKNLEEVNILLSKEEVKLKSAKSENLQLCNKINDLKREIFETKQKEEELAELKRKNAELRSNLENLKDKEKEARAALEMLELVKAENLELCSQISYLKREFIFLNQKEINPEDAKLVDRSTSMVRKNEELISSIDDIEKCCDAVEMLKLAKSENLDLCNQINKLRKDFLDLKQNELISTLKNEELSEELTRVNKDNSKLSTTVKDLKEKSKISSLELEKDKLDFLNVKTKELEDIIADLNNRNKILNKSLEEVKQLLSKEKEMLHSAKSENLSLSDQINNMKKEFFSMQQKELELTLKNEEIAQELKRVNQDNYELKSTMENLEKKKNESSDALDLLTVELQKNKLNLLNMNEKCLEYEKKLDEQMKMSTMYEEKLRSIKQSSSNEKEHLHNNIQDLKNKNNQFQAELESMKSIKLSLEQENNVLSANLQSKCLELASLQEQIDKVSEDRESLTSKCKNLETELIGTKEILQSLQEKCSGYEEEVLSKFKISEEEYCQKLKELEAKSLAEKKELLAEISKLSHERKDILQKLDAEKEHYENLVAEKEELNKKIVEGCEQISSLKQLNEDLKKKQQHMLQRNEFFEKALHSSNDECGKLSADLKILRETLQNLESKCMIYEKEIVAAAGVKDNLVDCLLNITSEISGQRLKLNELCKGYGKEVGEVFDRASVSDLIPVIDDNVKKTCDNLSIESKKLILSVDFIIKLMNSFYLKSLEIKNIEEKFDQKTASLSKKVEFHKVEGDHLKSQNDHLQCIINELQQSISEKEKSNQYSAYEIQSLKEKISRSESEIEKGNELLKRKDDEVTKLQERVFNLQSYVNTIIAEKTSARQRDSPSNLLDSEADSVSSTSQLSSPKQASKEVQTDEKATSSPLSSDESLAAAERERNSCCQQLLKKYQSLQTKLALCKKRIEILEKEKNDLREHYLNQIKVSPTAGESEELINSKLANLESELEKKKAFISELKAELLKTCNSLIDKEKEVDDLRIKLSESEKKSKDTSSDIPTQTVGSPKAVDNNIRNLRNYKWKLIQTIFEIQERFYEKRGIHLNYIEKFKEHVNRLYSMQLTQSLSKSESLPLLDSHKMKLSSVQGEDKLKCVVGLELDIECLENLKIFLNRFFVPSMLQDSTSQLSSAKKLSLEPEAKKMNISDFETLSSLGISFPSTAAVHLTSEDKLSCGKSLSFENFVSSVSHSLDCIQSLFTTIEGKFESLETTYLPAKESVTKAEVNNLLVKISEEVKSLQGGVDKLSSFNSHLKNLGFVIATIIPSSFSRPDVSDRESLMSEETIGISRSESPLSFDELGSLKLSCPESLHLEGQTLESKSAGERGVVVEGRKVAKATAVEGSCDSVCQRSHYSSPDLGIESDPNHESSAPEQKEEAITLYRKTIEEKKFMFKPPQPKTAFTETESAGRFRGITYCETLYSIGKLQHFELLKREVQESLVGIKSVLLRTGDGLHHVAKYTSPRKTLEYSTLKAIKDSCANIEVCLKKAYSLINEFRTAPCPTESEWKALIDENQSQREQLTHLKEMVQKQEKEYKKAIKRLEHAQLVNAHMEKKISKKLVKTKKDIRLAEQKLLENMCQNLPPVPKYPSEQANMVPQTRDV